MSEYLELKPDPKEGESLFGKSGAEYRWHIRLSVPRYKQLEKLKLMFAYNASFEEVHQSFLQLKALLNKTDFVEAASEVMKRLEGLGNLKNDRMSGVELVCLFLIGPDEDPATFDEVQHTTKINDIEAAGYSADFFFTEALSLIPPLTKYIKELRQELYEL
jgi:hypothetical protein